MEGMEPALRIDERWSARADHRRPSILSYLPYVSPWFKRPVLNLPGSIPANVRGQNADNCV